MNRDALLLRYRLVLGAFTLGLVLSGVTAFPLLHELELLANVLGIPVYWRLIDCSFGIFGTAPLVYCLRLTQKIAHA